MFAFLHRFIRKALIVETQTLINQHPFYSATLNAGKFQNTPVNVIEKFAFEGRNFPIIILDKTSATEQVMAMDKKLDDKIGHCRAHTMLNMFFNQIYDDVTYTGAYVDGVHNLAYINIDAENNEQIVLRIDSRYSEEFDLVVAASTQSITTTYTIDKNVIISGTGTYLPVATPTPAAGEYYITPDSNTIIFGPISTTDTITVSYQVAPVIKEVQEDGKYLDAIPGAVILMGAFNSIRPGATMQVDTFKTERLLGEIFGSRFKVAATMKVYAQSQSETEDLMDLLHSFFLYYLPVRFYNAYGINIVNASSNDMIEKTGELGEEAYTGALSINLNVEAQTFSPVELLTGHIIDLWLELRQDISTPGTPELIAEVILE